MCGARLTDGLEGHRPPLSHLAPNSSDTNRFHILCVVLISVTSLAVPSRDCIFHSMARYEGLV